MPRVIGALSVLLGVTVLFGWATGVTALTRFVPDGITIRPNAALGFLLCGVALLVLAPGAASLLPRWARWLGRACAAATALIGGLTLVEYISGVDLRVDLLLFQGAQRAMPARIGGRMGINAALEFLLLGSAVLLLDVKRRVRPSEVLAQIAGVIALVALVGHLFGEADLYALRNYTPMAIPGAITFALVASAVLLARPDGALMSILTGDTPGGSLTRRLLPWVLAGPAMIGWLRLRGQHAGYFDMEFGLALMVVSSMLLLGSVVLWTARSVDRSDAQRHEAEAARHRSEVILGAVFDATPDAVYVKDQAGRYVLINEAGAHQLGRSVAEIRGHTDEEILPAAAADSRRVRREQLLVDGATRTFEETVTVDGATRVLLTTKGVYRDQAGDVAGVFGMSRDITEVKQVDEVRRARDAAEAANRELEAFAYSVSHDLRAPLRSIDGFSQALLEDYAAGLDDTGRHYLERVRVNAQRMAQLIDDLLDLSRVTRSELHRGPVDLSATARAIVTELQHRQPERHVDVVVAEGLVTQGDERLLHVALENLLGNAWKFTAHKAAARIEVGRTDADGQTAFFVRDDGAGFDMRYADKLFGAFQRLHSAKEFEGNGIGLATVQRIVRRHGGRIWGEGAVDRGATFFFTLR